ncbi:MAG: DUF3592 domain-containing protein [Trueperaceae bacterium]|nr:DUF3592 domain-containing protein [Trueperaceae bacterium]
MAKLFQHWVFLIALAIALLIGVASYYFARPALEVLRLARASSHWTETTAQVTSAVIDSNYSGVSSSTPNYHTPQVRYSYEVNGQAYESDTILFGHLRLTNRAGKAAAQRILDPYRNYPIVSAYYNPENPAQAVLEPGFKLRSLHALANVGLGFAIALGVLGAGFWLDPPFAKLSVIQQSTDVAKEALLAEESRG